MAFDPTTAKPLPGGFDPSTAKPEQTGGAAFGIYPKQRATPSRPETKEAVQKGVEAAASGMEALGFFPPSEEKEFDTGACWNSHCIRCWRWSWWP